MTVVGVGGGRRWAVMVCLVDGGTGLLFTPILRGREKGEVAGESVTASGHGVTGNARRGCSCQTLRPGQHKRHVADSARREARPVCAT